MISGAPSGRPVNNGSGKQVQPFNCAANEMIQMKKAFAAENSAAEAFCVWR